MQFAIQQRSTQVLKLTTESKRAVEQLIRYLKGTQHTCLRLEPGEMVQKGSLELVGRSDSDWAGDTATCQSVAVFHCNVQGVTMRNRSLKQTAIRLHAKQSSTQRVLAQVNCLESHSSSRNFTATFQCVSRRIQTRQDTLYSASDQAGSSISKYDVCQFYPSLPWHSKRKHGF